MVKQWCQPQTWSMLKWIRDYVSVKKEQTKARVGDKNISCLNSTPHFCD